MNVCTVFFFFFFHFQLSFMQKMFLSVLSVIIDLVLHMKRRLVQMYTQAFDSTLSSTHSLNYNYFANINDVF